MSIIRQKSKQRHRLQFTLDRNLHEQYRTLRATGKALGFEIDFSEDFALWFAAQLKELTTKLHHIQTTESKEDMQW